MESHPRKQLIGHQALNWIVRIRKPVCATVAMTVAGATLGLTSISADLGPNAHIMMKSTVGGNALETLPAQTRSRGASVRYRMEPLPDRPEPYTDSRMRLWLPDQSMNAMLNGITSWDEYSAFRINDAGQVAGWTNLAFPCDDSVDPDNPSLSSQPTAATWLRQDGAYSDISLLQFDGDAHSSMATGISESGRIVGLRQFEGPDSDVIEHCRGSITSLSQAVYWADGNANGVPFPLHADPSENGTIRRSAAFDVIDTLDTNSEATTKITGIVEYESCGGKDRWYYWDPIENTVTEPSASPAGNQRDTHMLEFSNQLGGMLVGTGLPIETGEYASCQPCHSCNCTHWQYGCYFAFKGFGAIVQGTHEASFDYVQVIHGDCANGHINCTNDCTNVSNYLDFFSEVNRAADDNMITGWRLGGDGGNASCGGACCINGLCIPSSGLNDCHSYGGYYLGDDTCCEGSCISLLPDCEAECPDVSGVCCVDGTCLSNSPFMSYRTCINMGGSFHFGETCGAIDCDEATGACCINSGDNCLTMIRRACEDETFNGTYLGDNLTCDESDCTPGSDDDCSWTQVIYRNGPYSPSVMITRPSDQPGDADGGGTLNSRGLGIRHAPTLPGGIETRIVGWQESADPDYDRFDSTQAMLWEGPPASENDAWPATNLDDLLQDGLISLNGLDAYEDRPFPEIHVDQLKLRLREAHDINHNGEIVAILRVQPDEVDYKDIAVVLIPIECESQCPGDLNNNGIVNGQDLTILLGYWGSTTRICEDLNDDGVIDAADMTIMLGSWGRCTRVKRTRNARF